MTRQLALVMYTIGLLLGMSCMNCIGAPADQTISEEVAVVTQLPQPAVEITDWDIALQTDLPNNRLHVTASCALRNHGDAPVGSLDFDLLGAERFYGVKVTIAKILRRVDNMEAKVAFRRFIERQPDDSVRARTHEYPEVTRVSLAPTLKKGERCRLVFEYTIACTDIHDEKLHYKLICERADGTKETCLITDFSWFPRLAPDSREAMDSRFARKHFFARHAKPTWRVTLTHPVKLEAVTLGGKLESRTCDDQKCISRWKSIVGGQPQLFVGASDRVENTRDDVKAVFLLPPDGYDREFVDAVGDLVVSAYGAFSDWFGPLAADEIYIVATSGIRGGHGAFMGMTIESSYFQQNKHDHLTESGRFFVDMPVHELAHSWWGGSVSSYGRGSKFLRESFANFAAWHLARECYGTDRFRSSLHNNLFRWGVAGKPLFKSTSDEDRFAYEKGPLVLDVLRQEMGDAVFFPVLKEFARRHKNGNASFIDFVSVCNDVSRRDWMPFFYQWCYAKGCPAYHLLGFESTRSTDEWVTNVKIRNDGAGIVRCPLELQMEKENRSEVFWVPPGEDRTLVFQTDKRVIGVAIDQQRTTYQVDESEDLTIAEGEMTDEERAAIDEFHQIRQSVENGGKYDDRSTPLRAALREFSRMDSLSREYFVEMLDVIRAPLPPDEPQEGMHWPVYMKRANGTKLADTLILTYSKGQWTWSGNMGSGRDWREVQRAMEQSAQMK